MYRNSPAERHRALGLFQSHCALWPIPISSFKGVFSEPQGAINTSVCSKRGGLLGSCRSCGLGVLCVAEVQAGNFAFMIIVLLPDLCFFFFLLLPFSLQNFEVEADDLVTISELGRGAYGVVEKVRHAQSGTIMAVKVRMASSWWGRGAVG